MYCAFLSGLCRRGQHGGMGTLLSSPFTHVSYHGLQPPFLIAIIVRLGGSHSPSTHTFLSSPPCALWGAPFRVVQ